jgi:F-type H+-transporting ATPase subunit gamma
MASINDLKKRIGSVKNTQQITRAMKLVSAAKLRRSQDAIQSQRPYAQEVSRLIRLASGLQEEAVMPRVFRRSKQVTELSLSERKVLLVLVTSDRGLCGSFNVNVIKKAEQWIAANADQYASIAYAGVGKKTKEFFTSRKMTPVLKVDEFGPKAEFKRSQVFANWLLSLFLEGDFDEIKVIFNEFKNAITQVVAVEDFLPILPEGEESEPNQIDSEDEAPIFYDELYIVKPSPQEILDRLLDRHFGIQIFRILLDSQASEHGARMGAMENATKNAGEMINNLTLQYNKQRQAAITTELLEIIAGSESQKTA